MKTNDHLLDASMLARVTGGERDPVPLPPLPYDDNDPLRARLIPPRFWRRPAAVRGGPRAA